MVQKVSGKHFFHVTRDLPYNKNPPIAPSMKLKIGDNHNPFFGFYENVREYPVDTPEGQINCKALRFLKLVRDGEINCPGLAQIAHEVAEHYVMLVRELIMEEVRKDVAPNAPSRQSCLWVLETVDQAKYWQQRLGGTSRIARLQLYGVVHHADASLLLGDSEPLSVTYERAHAYWRGEMSENPESEALFRGKATVIDTVTRLN